MTIEGPTAEGPRRLHNLLKDLLIGEYFGYSYHKQHSPAPNQRGINLVQFKAHFYQIPQSPNFPRPHLAEGALIAIEGDNNLVGYADLHPWPTLGDLNVHTQLQLLKEGRPTKQMQRSLDFARRDLVAKQSLTIGVQYLKEIKNHHLLLEKHLTTNDLKALISINSSSSLLKWKISPETATHTANLLNQICLENSQLKWRLDANSLFSFKEVMQFWKSLSPLSRKNIDFIEDPCPYDKSHWTHLENEGLPLAIDLELTHWSSTGPLEAASLPTSSSQTIFVLKPAIHKTEDWKLFFQQTPSNFLFTSYLDHPIGLLHALWTTEIFAQIFPHRLLPCGLNFSFPPHLLETFWSGLQLNESVWCGEKSVGIGYNQHLENLSWQTLGTTHKI